MEGEEMTQYEYKIVGFDENVGFVTRWTPSEDEDRFLRSMGKEGWELVSVTYHDKYYFKRVKK